MRIKSAYKYQLNELKRPAIIYYGIIVVLCILVVVAKKIWDFDGSFSGFDAATIIFLFVCGLNAFKAPFHMFIANGISRKAMFLSSIAAFATAAVGMAMVDSVIGLGMSALTPYASAFSFQYGEWYGLFAGARETCPMIVGGFVWRTVSYMTAALIGLFLTTAYYRMNKPVKLLVSIGVPVLLFVVWPIVDATSFGGAMTTAIMHALGWVSSLASRLLGAGSPYIAVLFDVFWIALLGFLTWLLMRRATVKTQ
jgi:hypothetical protein